MLLLSVAGLPSAILFWGHPTLQRPASWFLVKVKFRRGTGRESKENRKRPSDFILVLILFCGTYWIRTSDPLLVRQVLWTNWAKLPFSFRVLRVQIYIDILNEQTLFLFLNIPGLLIQNHDTINLLASLFNFCLKVPILVMNRKKEPVYKSSGNLVLKEKLL